MKKYLPVFIFFFLSFSLIQGNPVSVEKAKLAAKSFYKIQSGKSDFVISDIYSESIKNVPTYYIFSIIPSGFVIVAADDCVQPILAYSLTGSYNPENRSSGEKEWLHGYSKGIYDAILYKQNKVHKDWNRLFSGSYKSVKSLVTPLCTTLWDQTCYYNELCPADGLGPCGHAVTGCVATATAQVMKYWNYPPKGQGMHSYTSTWYGNLSANFDTTVYDWVSMPDVVTSSNLSVATLMYQIGVSVDMEYYATSSGSSLNLAGTSLPDYFKYSDNIEFVNKQDYTDSSWVELMKNELNSGRPVLYQGFPDSTWMSGHAWVCDGYDSNDFLHFNWGWGPGNEGYYEMDSFIYRRNNAALIKIMPVVSCDIALRDLVEPVSATFQVPSVIKVKVSNYDTLPHANIPVSYKVDGGSLVTETIIAPIAALSDTVYEFVQPFDFSPNPGHVYNVKVYSDLPCDEYSDNDTISVNVENVACSSPPYSMGFEPSENMTGWVVQDVNNDSSQWSFGPGGNFQPTCAWFGCSGQANDWLISKCLQLESNKVYKLSYYWKTCFNCPGQKLHIYIGNQQNVSSLTTILADFNSITNANFQKEEVYFTVPATGGYYIGWFCDGASDNTMVLDDIFIQEQTAIDVGITPTIFLPDETCDMQQEYIQAVVRNYCSSVLNNIQISYTINGGTSVTETITTPINIGDSLEYTFSSSVDFSADGVYNVKIFTSLTGDTLYNNDTLSVNVINHVSIVPYYTMGFEPSEDFSGWKIYNNNNDTYKWSIKNTGGYSQPYCIRYDYSSWIPADDWFVSSCINLYALQTYKLGFWYKIESSQWPEKLKVFLGNGQDYSFLTTQLLDFPNLTNTMYQYSEVLFTVPSDGLYFLGWYCYSDALMYNLYIDDISIDMTTAENERVLSDNYYVFPNPCNDKIMVTHNSQKNDLVNYEIIDLSGKKIKEISSNSLSTQILTKELARGMYFLKIISGKEVKTEKFVKR